jgi:predicted GNAT family acetyltransferase
MLWRLLFTQWQVNMEATHDTAGHQFLINTDSGESYLRYRVTEVHIDFYTTFVHPGDRGSKVGVTLVKSAVDWAVEQGFDMQASCWYVDKYLRKHGYVE